MSSAKPFLKHGKTSIHAFFKFPWLLISFGVILVSTACSSVAFAGTENFPDSVAMNTLPATEMLIREVSPSLATEPPDTTTPVFTSITTSTLVPETRRTPYYWREWAIDPELSPRTREIIAAAINNPNLDLQTFSKVGDCQMTSGTFLGGFANGKYAIPDGYGDTVRWFSDSMAGESITAANGLGINSVLNPIFGFSAGYQQCGKSETPLDCELRTQRPAFVLIAMGTNWKPAGEVSFENHLRVVVERVLETGALPILATKADNIEGDWKLNQAIAQVAYDYDLPLVNVWRSVQDLPNHGLEAPENIYLTGDGWMRRNYAWLATLDKIRLAILEQPAD